MIPIRGAGSRFSGPGTLQRARVRFSRTGVAAQYTHLKQIEALRRALEASPWPLAKSQAKKPKPKLSFGPAISVGYESDAEYCDVELAGRPDFRKAKEELDGHLPAGFSVVSARSIPRFFPSLEESVNLARFDICSPLLEGRRDAWDRFWSADRFIVVKKKADREEAIDARACVKSWSLDGDRLSMMLRFGPGRTLKPERIVQAVCGLADADVAMGTPDAKLAIRRTHLYLEKENGELIEP